MTRPDAAGRAPQQPFDHVLLTRFSAVLQPGAPPADEVWLRYRLGFFIDACRASVMSQRDADFTWLVLFDDRCSPDFRTDVEELAEGVFTPIWSSAVFTRDAFVQPVIEATQGSGSPFLITTRIDSDDAMAVDFIASVQREFDGQDRLFVNFTRGLQVARDGGVYGKDQPSSPFLSYIERRVDGRVPETVFVARHARAREHAAIREVKAPAMWVQVVHDTNLLNIVNGARVAPTVIADRFDWHLGYDADVRGLALLRAKARHRVRLLGLWRRHPGEFVTSIESRVPRWRGTRDWPRTDQRTVADRLSLWSRRRGLRKE